MCTVPLYVCAHVYIYMCRFLQAFRTTDSNRMLRRLISCSWLSSAMSAIILYRGQPHSDIPVMPTNGIFLLCLFSCKFRYIKFMLDIISLALLTSFRFRKCPVSAWRKRKMTAAEDMMSYWWCRHVETIFPHEKHIWNSTRSFIPHAARVRAERCPAKTACAHIEREKNLSPRHVKA